MTSLQPKAHPEHGHVQNEVGDSLKRLIIPTSLDALIASLKQVGMFYASAARHLRDYRSVIEIFEDLVGECRRFRA